jgi:hypothetical protein
MHDLNNQDNETKAMFTSYTEFKKRLEGTFSNINKEQNTK